jgi:putative transposase
MGLDATLNKSKKIRIYPTSFQKNLFSQWFGASRFTFNESVKHLNLPEVKASWKSIKTGIIHDLPDWSESIPYQIKSIAIRDCCGAVQNAKKKFKLTGVIQKVKFRSRKDPEQSCYIPKSAIKELGIYYTLTKELKWSEPLPDNCLDSRLVKNNGRYYVAISYIKTIKLSENQGKIVALDPGIRTFNTFYSEQSCGKIGYGDFKRIFRLCKVMDKLQSILSDKSLMFYKRCNLKKSLGRLRWKVRDLVSELHHKTAIFLVKNFDVIFLPTFEVSEMVNRLSRKIKSKSARQMLTLSHFRFKKFLKHKAFEYGKVVVDVCEAYTTKTVSWTGEVIQSMGGRKTIVSKLDGQKMDRDLNGARGIFLRALGDTPIFKSYLEDKLVVGSV